MKTIKELEAERNKTKSKIMRIVINAEIQKLKDVLKLIKELKDKIDNAQEDCGNLDWISKEQALKIIDKELKARIEGVEPCQDEIRGKD